MSGLQYPFVLLWQKGTAQAVTSGFRMIRGISGILGEASAVHLDGRITRCTVQKHITAILLQWNCRQA
jgi:hypothetical protein